ncbi:MAG: Glycerol-3-phosphate acyltransferase [Saprospiraceae bacterium]|nr:Glycerol-3-phosphate acyltransferase [Saprospiraceae bacterium]
MQAPYNYQKFQQLVPDMENWPVYRFFSGKKEFLLKLRADVMEQLSALSKEELDQVVARTLYLEKQRVKNSAWKVDPPNEMQYYRKIQAEYNTNHLLPDPHPGNLDTASRLVNRFSAEIFGHFNSKTFSLARKLSDFFFHLMLFPFSLSSLFGLKRMHLRNQESIMLNGHLEEVRQLFLKHTVVLVPTHSSNLDSMLLGYALDLAAGLPAFSYGAGLNLYDSEFFAFFMNRLGAYRVDRRKKNSIYLHTLTSYSKLSIFDGVNTIFFPGGTRSRSGEIESKLKLGLLGSLIQAQRMLVERGEERKIVIVPMVINYESVLEARALIFQHLANTGQEKFTSRGRKPGLISYWRFMGRFLKQSSGIYLSFGKPMDVFGNYFDQSGNSMDGKSHPVNLRDYFRNNGSIVRDEQREMIYTRELGEKIAQAYKQCNFIIPAHLVAHAAFLMLARVNSHMDVYALAQLPEEEYRFPAKDFTAICTQLRDLLIHRAERGELIYPLELEGPIDRVVEKGVHTLGCYHLRRVLLTVGQSHYASEDFPCLIYYSNRLQCYDLKDELDWSVLGEDLPSKLLK